MLTCVSWDTWIQLPPTTWKTSMGRKIKEVVRDRFLTEEEAAKYRQIRELVADELPELRARAKARIRELREVTEIFTELQKARKAQGLAG